MCDKNNTNLETDSDPEEFLTNVIQFKMEQEIFSNDTQKALKRYFQLSIKEELCKTELEELIIISEVACKNKDLLVLIELIDHHINENRYLSDGNFLAEIEESRINALNRILGADETPQPAASKYSVTAAKKKLFHLFRTGLMGNKWRLMTLSLLPLLPLSALGLMSIFHQFNSETASHQPIYNEPTGPAPEDMTENHCKVQAGWIDTALEGRLTAYGEIFKNAAFTAAHEFLPLGSKIRLQSKNNRNSVTVRVIDRSDKFVVSQSAAQTLDLIDQGVGPVKVTAVDVENKGINDLTAVQRIQLEEFKEECNPVISYSTMTAIDE